MLNSGPGDSTWKYATLVARFAAWRKCPGLLWECFLHIEKARPNWETGSSQRLCEWRELLPKRQHI